MTGKYKVTYNINDQMFTVNRDKAGLPNMEFLMHESGLNYYKPPKNGLLFLNTVSKKIKVLARYRSRMMSKIESYSTPLGLPQSGK